MALPSIVASNKRAAIVAPHSTILPAAFSRTQDIQTMLHLAGTRLEAWRNNKLRFPQTRSAATVHHKQCGEQSTAECVLTERAGESVSETTGHCSNRKACRPLHTAVAKHDYLLLSGEYR